MLKDIIRDIMAAGEVPLLIGEAGIGKTTMIHDIAKETGRRVIEIPLQVMDAEDFIGMPFKTEDGRFDFLLPNWFPTDKEAKTIIFLDEINRSTRRVRGALLKLVLERQLNGHKLPADTWIAAAMNPATDDYEVDDVMDQAFLSRFIRIEMPVDTDDWLAWAKRSKLHKAVISFIASNRKWLLTKVADDIEINPRTWAKVSNILKAVGEEKILEYGFTLFKNQLGAECTTVFLQHIKEAKNRVSAEDVLRKPKEFTAAIKKLPDDKRNVLLTTMADYVLEKKRNGVDYYEDFSNALTVLQKVFEREQLAGVFRYLVKLADSGDLNASKLLEYMANTEIGEMIYEAISAINADGAEADNPGYAEVV